MRESRSSRVWLIALAFSLGLSAETAFAQFGACCLPDGSCIETDQFTCHQLGGNFFLEQRCGDVRCGPEVPCQDVKKFKTRCRPDSGKLKIIVVMIDARHSGETLSVVAGPYWLDMVISGQRARYVESGWIGSPEIVLVVPGGCFDPQVVECANPAGKKKCSHEITGLAVANGCDGGGAAGCPDRTGNVVCPESGKECDTDADCTGRTDIAIACSNDTGTPKKKFCRYPSKRLACDCD